MTGLGALRDRTQCVTVMGENTKADVVSMRLSDGDKLDIEFDHAGSKKVVARWVIPADQVDDVPF